VSELVTEAVVLRRVDYGESDRILTLFTRDAGKLSALARSARRSRRRFGGALMSFSVSTLELKRRPGVEMWTLVSAQPGPSFESIASDMVALAHASYGTELVRELLAVEVVEPEVFELLVELFRNLDAHGPHPPMLRGFELALLRHLGLEPSFASCVRCERGDDDRFAVGAVFDPGAGGVVCRSCAAQATGLGVRPLGDEARRLLVRCAQIPHLDQTRAIAADGEGSREARDLMLALVQGQIGRPLKSLEFAAKLRSGEQ